MNSPSGTPYKNEDTPRIRQALDSVRQYPDVYICYIELGVAYQEVGRIDEAANAYRDAIQRIPLLKWTNPPRLLWVPDGEEGETERQCIRAAYLNLGMICEQQGSPQEATRLYRELLCIFPDCHEAQQRLEGPTANLMPYLTLQLDEQTLFSDSDGELRRQSQLVKLNFVHELNLVTYLALDSEASILRCNMGQLREWSIDGNQAFKIAFEHLSKRTHKENLTFIVNETGKVTSAVFYNSGKDGYDATRILLPWLRIDICRKLGTDYCFIGIPNRDFLIAFAPDPQKCTRLHELVKMDFQRRDHPVSPGLFRADANGNLWLVADDAYGLRADVRIRDIIH